MEELELRNEIQKQIQSMPGQQKQVIEYYQKNPAAANSLRGSIYEEKIIDLIKSKSKKTIKTISSKEAEQILKIEHEKMHKHHHNKNDTSESDDKTKTKKSQKSKKLPHNKKKIRKK